MITRRDFIKGTAAMGGLMFLPSCATKRVKGINGKMNIAVIGAGGMGYAIFNYIKDADNVNVVAMCDVDKNRASKAIKQFPNVPFFTDYRVMFDKMGDKIDGVTVSTPDHMHYPISAWAIANGKHVFAKSLSPAQSGKPKSLRDSPPKRASSPRWAIRATPTKAGA